MMQKKTVTTNELREFGIIFGAILVMLFGFLLPWIFDWGLQIWPWWVFVITGSMAIIYPLSLKAFYNLWMLFGSVMGWINTRLILGIIFYLVFVPFGLVIKLFGKDLLSLKLESKITSYRVINKVSEKDNMENPF
jgi:hypothetical protein